mgnify:CR=1 FL=1
MVLNGLATSSITLITALPGPLCLQTSPVYSINERLSERSVQMKSTSYSTMQAIYFNVCLFSKVQLTACRVLS